MRNAYKMTGELFKCDPYSKIWKYYIATAERLYMLQAIVRLIKQPESSKH